MARHDPEREARLKEAAGALQRASDEVETVAVDLAPSSMPACLQA